MFSREDKASFRSWPSGWRGQLISLTSTGSPNSRGYRGRRYLVHRRDRASLSVPSSGRDGQMGRLLATVVRHIAHYPIRMRGTFCGSIAHADPASEWCLMAATLCGENGGDEQARTARHRGERFLRRDHDDGAGGGRNPHRSSPAGHFRPRPVSASTSSTGAPAILQSRWRW